MSQRLTTLGMVWDVDTLTHVRQQQAVLKTDTLTVSLAGVATAANQTTGNTTLSSLLTELQAKADLGETQPVSLSNFIPIAASGQVTGVGNNTLITPTSGKKIRLHYCAYNPTLAAEVAFRFGAAGTLFLRNNLTANSVVAKDFGAVRALEGAIDEALILNLSLGVATNWNVFYTEV